MLQSSLRLTEEPTFQPLAMEAARIQAQIRENSLEVSDFLTDLKQWESQITKKDKSLLKTKRKNEGGDGKEAPEIRVRNQSIR